MDGTPTYLRFAIFLAVLILFIGLEARFPARNRVMARWARWRTNLSLSVLGSVTGGLASPILAVSVAALAADHQWGAFHQIDAPAWLEILLAVIILDFVIWAQHVTFHYVPALWRLHKVHHTDRDLDATSGVRFHPVEIGVSLIWKALAILALGPAVIAVIIFEIALNASAIFTHANISLPPRIDRVARTFFVTPDMHRVHHSVVERETNTNFGFNLSIWDRLFRTYTPEASGELTLGLSDHQTDRPAQLLASLILPFQGKTR